MTGMAASGSRVERAAAGAAGLLAAGSLAWIPARWGVMTTWDGTWLGLDYGS